MSMNVQNVSTSIQYQNSIKRVRSGHPVKNGNDTHPGSEVMRDRTETSFFGRIASKELQLLHGLDEVRHDRIEAFKASAVSNQAPLPDTVIDDVFARMTGRLAHS